MIRIVMLGAIAVSVAVSISAIQAVAHPPLVAKAKSAGMPAKNCQYCHVSAMPKKDSYKADDLNDRGKWMLAEKETRKAKAVDAAWLKDYPGGKEQK